MTFKEEKTKELFAHLAAEFLQRESNGQSMITVTRADVMNRMSKVIIFISVFPETKQDAALDFAKRKRTEFREYVGKHARMRRVPMVDFEIDIGEKNRQRLDELSAEYS